MIFLHLHFLLVILLSHPVFFLNPIFSSFLYLSNVTARYMFFFFLSLFTLHSSLAPYFSAQRAYFFHGIYWRWHQASDCGWGGWSDHSLEGNCKRERERKREREKEERGEVDEEKKWGRYDTSLEGNSKRERERESWLRENRRKEREREKKGGRYDNSLEGNCNRKRAREEMRKDERKV